MKALVLAAGKSTRISSVSEGLPKPLINVGGTTIIERSLKWLSSNDITDVWINLHYKPEVIQQAIGDGAQTGCNVRYSIENEILGTAGAVKCLEAEWDDDFMVVYGDNLLGFNIAEMIKQHKEFEAIATIAVFDWNNDAHSNIAGGRVIMDDSRNITEFTEGAEDCSSPWVNAGVYVLSTEICSLIGVGFSDFGKDIFPELLRNNLSLKGFPINSYCLAADTPEALIKANDFFNTEKIQ